MIASQKCLKRFESQVFLDDIPNEIDSIKQTVEGRIAAGWHPEIARGALTVAASMHFKLPHLEEESVLAWFGKARDAMCDYYCSNWWQPEQLKAWADRKGLEGVDRLLEVNGYSDMNPQFEGKVGLRRIITSSAFLIASLLNDTDSLERMAEWFDLRVEPEFCGGEIEDEYQLGLLCIISRFRTKPIPGIEAIQDKIAACRHDRPRVLLDLINSAFNAEQHLFDTSLKKSLKLHYRRLDPSFITDLIAPEQSILTQVAKRNGLVLPKLDQTSVCALLTPESAGLLK